jgi:hypothetical protein
MKKIAFVLILILFVFSSSFAIAINLKTIEASNEEVKGVFTLILYGGRDMNDIERLAILDLEGDKYTFEPYAPEFDYKIKKSLSEKEALEMSHKFVSSHNAFYHSQLSRIIDDKGNTIGYELRPLYMPFIYGVSDVLDVYYSLKGEKVRAYIRIIPSVERALPERSLVS